MVHFTRLHTDSAESPSGWLRQHAHHIKPCGHVLDIAAGSGRNARWLARQGFSVEAVDRDEQALGSMQGLENINIRLADIENGDWPYKGQQFDAIVVCRYLHRPLFAEFINNLAPAGVLIYETFMQGHEIYGRPTNPDFLLKPDELLEAFQNQLEVVAFEQIYQETPRPAMMQRLCAIKPDNL